MKTLASVKVGFSACFTSNSTRLISDNRLLIREREHPTDVWETFYRHATTTSYLTRKGNFLSVYAPDFSSRAAAEKERINYSARKPEGQQVLYLIFIYIYIYRIG